MLVKDVITTDVKFTTKAVKYLDMSTKEFFIKLNTVRSSTAYKQDYIDEVIHILNKMSEVGVVKLADKDSVSGIPFLDDIQDELVIPSTKEVLLRKGKSVAVLETTNSHISSDIVKLSSVPFDTYVALKFISKQQNAINRGIEFTLTLNDMKRLLKTKKCYYSGVTLEQEGELGLTLDRVDSSKGYTPDNTKACAKIVNDIKNELLDTGLNIDKLGVDAVKRMLIVFSNCL